MRETKMQKITSFKKGKFQLRINSLIMPVEIETLDYSNVYFHDGNFIHLSNLQQYNLSTIHSRVFALVKLLSL